MFRPIHKVALSLATATLISASPAHAGMYHMRTYGNLYGAAPGDWVMDIVTDAFTQRFPYQKYSIVVFVDDPQLGDDTVCSARAGISAKAKRGLSSRMPILTFSSTQILRNRGSLTTPEKQDCIKFVVRGAVQDLMNTDVERIAKESAASLVD
jgi:hypothetical protein